MVAGAGDKRSGHSIHQAFEGLVAEEPFGGPHQPAPPRPPGAPPADAPPPPSSSSELLDQLVDGVRQSAEEAARASVAALAERFDRKIDGMSALLEMQGTSAAADQTRIDALREELRSAVAGMGQELKAELTRLSHGLARDTAEIRGELEGLAVQVYQAATEAAGPAAAEGSGDGIERLRAELAAQRRQLRAEVDAALAGMADPRGETWRGLRSNLEILLAGSSERLRAEVAHDQDEFRAEMRSALAGILDRHAKALVDRLASLEAAVTSDAGPGRGDDVRAAVTSALTAHTRSLDDRVARLEDALAETGERLAREAGATRMELRAEVQAVLAAAMAAGPVVDAGPGGEAAIAAGAVREALVELRTRQETAWADLRAAIASSEPGGERLRAEISAALADASTRQAAAWDESLANAGERLREELDIHRRDLTAALDDQAGTTLRQVQALIDASVRAAVADAAEGQSRVLQERTAQLAAAASTTSERLRDELAAMRSESGTVVEGALAAVIRQQGQAWEARRAELEAALADTFERVQAVIADEREALETARSELVAARLEDPQRISRLETAVADMSRRMAELVVSTMEASNRQIEELRQIQNEIFENSRQLYAVLNEEGEQSAGEMRALLRQAQRVMEESRAELRAEISDAMLRASTDQERRFHVQAAELDEAMSRNAADHARQLDRQTAALEAILHSFGQRLAEDRRAADLTAQSAAGDTTTALGRLRDEVHHRLNEVAAASARAAASADTALAELRAAQERAVGLDELREAVSFLRAELARFQRMVSARDRYGLSAAEGPSVKARAGAKKGPAHKRTAS